MSQIGQILQTMRDELASLYPGRVVTRTLRDFGQRKREELQRGIYTLVCQGEPPRQPGTGLDYIDALITGQFKLAESAAGEDVEEAELLMRDELVRWADGCQTAQVLLRGLRQSQQLEAPYGWVAISLRIGPLDLSVYPNAGSLDDFLRYHQELDAGSATGRLRAEDDVALPQGDEP